MRSNDCYNRHFLFAARRLSVFTPPSEMKRPNERTERSLRLSATQQWAHECSNDQGVSVAAVFSQFDRHGNGMMDPLEVITT